MNKKKKKLTLKKIKRICLALWLDFVDYIKALRIKFMKLPKKIRLVSYVWSGALLIILVLLLGSISNAKFMNKYESMESAMNAAALHYMESVTVYPVKDNKLILDLEVLRDEGYIYEEDIKDKTCSGFSAIYYDDINKEYIIDSFLSCKKYTTEGYLEQKK